ncbi:hypothetical protein CMUS01_10664 [Colletotrichum musicola]|uniref:Uncharacterized protein n=1 Tax=Colletotrichum musicola TaxID=2175873 RepID=A0A8H6K2X4_9PEZI|nr:hypothetical protein CMUS01_10664 [Colletotrichum musicola]
MPWVAIATPELQLEVSQLPPPSIMPPAPTTTSHDAHANRRRYLSVYFLRGDTMHHRTHGRVHIVQAYTERAVDPSPAPAHSEAELRVFDEIMPRRPASAATFASRYIPSWEWSGSSSQQPWKNRENSRTAVPASDPARD